MTDRAVLHSALPLLMAVLIPLLPTTSGLLASSSSVIDPVVARLQDAGMLEAEFTQTDHWALTLVDELSSGTVLLASPNLFRMIYTDPPGRVLGFDGDELYTVEPESEQVLVHQTGEPGSFIHLLESAADPAMVVLSEQSGDSVFAVLEGDFGDGISRMSVGFTLSDSLPWFFETVDFNGNSTSWSFSSFLIHQSCDRMLFELEVPAGYELLDAGAM